MYSVWQVAERLHEDSEWAESVAGFIAQDAPTWLALHNRERYHTHGTQASGAPRSAHFASMGPLGRCGAANYSAQLAVRRYIEHLNAIAAAAVTATLELEGTGLGAFEAEGDHAATHSSMNTFDSILLRPLLGSSEGSVAVIAHQGPSAPDSARSGAASGAPTPTPSPRSKRKGDGGSGDSRGTSPHRNRDSSTPQLRIPQVKALAGLPSIPTAKAPPKTKLEELAEVLKGAEEDKPAPKPRRPPRKVPAKRAAYSGRSVLNLPPALAGKTGQDIPSVTGDGCTQAKPRSLSVGSVRSVARSNSALSTRPQSSIAPSARRPSSPVVKTSTFTPRRAITPRRPASRHSDRDAAHDGVDAHGKEPHPSHPSEETPIKRAAVYEPRTIDKDKRRRAAMSHPKLDATLKRLWPLLPKDRRGCVTRVTYLRWSTRVFAVLAFDVASDEAMRHELAEREWGDRTDTLDEGAFLGLVRTKVDAWVETAASAEVLEFAQFLVRIGSGVATELAEQHAKLQRRDGETAASFAKKSTFVFEDSSPDFGGPTLAGLSGRLPSKRNAPRSFAEAEFFGGSARQALSLSTSRELDHSERAEALGVQKAKEPSPHSNTTQDGDDEPPAVGLATLTTAVHRSRSHSPHPANPAKPPSRNTSPVPQISLAPSFRVTAVGAVPMSAKLLESFDGSGSKGSSPTHETEPKDASRRRSSVVIHGLERQASPMVDSPAPSPSAAQTVGGHSAVVPIAMAGLLDATSGTETPKSASAVALSTVGPGGSCVLGLAPSHVPSRAGSRVNSRQVSPQRRAQNAMAASGVDGGGLLGVLSAHGSMWSGRHGGSQTATPLNRSATGSRVSMGSEGSRCRGGRGGQHHHLLALGDDAQAILSRNLTVDSVAAASAHVHFSVGSVLGRNSVAVAPDPEQEPAAAPRSAPGTMRGGTFASIRNVTSTFHRTSGATASAEDTSGGGHFGTAYGTTYATFNLNGQRSMGSDTVGADGGGFDFPSFSQFASAVGRWGVVDVPVVTGAGVATGMAMELAAKGVDLQDPDAAMFDVQPLIAPRPMSNRSAARALRIAGASPAAVAQHAPSLAQQRAVTPLGLYGAMLGDLPDSAPSFGGRPDTAETLPAPDPFSASGDTVMFGRAVGSPAGPPATASFATDPALSREETSRGAHIASATISPDGSPRSRSRRHHSPGNADLFASVEQVADEPAVAKQYDELDQCRYVRRRDLLRPEGFLDAVETAQTAQTTQDPQLAAGWRRTSAFGGQGLSNSQSQLESPAPSLPASGRFGRKKEKDSADADSAAFTEPFSSPGASPRLTPPGRRGLSTVGTPIEAPRSKPPMVPSVPRMVGRKSQYSPITDRAAAIALRVPFEWFVLAGVRLLGGEDQRRFSVSSTARMSVVSIGGLDDDDSDSDSEDDHGGPEGRTMARIRSLRSLRRGSNDGTGTARRKSGAGRSRRSSMARVMVGDMEVVIAPGRAVEVVPLGDELSAKISTRWFAADVDGVTTRHMAAQLPPRTQHALERHCDAFAPPDVNTARSCGSVLSSPGLDSGRHPPSDRQPSSTESPFTPARTPIRSVGLPPVLQPPASGRQSGTFGEAGLGTGRGSIAATDTASFLQHAGIVLDVSEFSVTIVQTASGGSVGASVDHGALSARRSITGQLRRRASIVPSGARRRQPTRCVTRVLGTLPIVARYDCMWEYANRTHTAWIPFPLGLQRQLTAWAFALREAVLDSASVAKSESETEVESDTAAAENAMAPLLFLREFGERMSALKRTITVELFAVQGEEHNFLLESMTLESWAGPECMVKPIRVNSLVMTPQHLHAPDRVPLEWLPPVIELFATLRHRPQETAQALRQLRAARRQCLVSKLAPTTGTAYGFDDRPEALKNAPLSSRRPTAAVVGGGDSGAPAIAVTAAADGSNAAETARSDSVAGPMLTGTAELKQCQETENYIPIQSPRAEPAYRDRETAEAASQRVRREVAEFERKVKGEHKHLVHTDATHTGRVLEPRAASPTKPRDRSKTPVSGRRSPPRSWSPPSSASGSRTKPKRRKRRHRGDGERDGHSGASSDESGSAISCVSSASSQRSASMSGASPAAARLKAPVVPSDLLDASTGQLSLTQRSTGSAALLRGDSCVRLADLPDMVGDVPVRRGVPDVNPDDLNDDAHAMWRREHPCEPIEPSLKVRILSQKTASFLDTSPAREPSSQALHVLAAAETAAARNEADPAPVPSRPHKKIEGSPESGGLDVQKSARATLDPVARVAWRLDDTKAHRQLPVANARPSAGTVGGAMRGSSRVLHSKPRPGTPGDAVSLPEARGATPASVDRPQTGSANTEQEAPAFLVQPEACFVEGQHGRVVELKRPPQEVPFAPMAAFRAKGTILETLAAARTKHSAGVALSEDEEYAMSMSQFAPDPTVEGSGTMPRPLSPLPEQSSLVVVQEAVVTVGALCCSPSLARAPTTRLPTPTIQRPPTPSLRPSSRAERPASEARRRAPLPCGFAGAASATTPDYKDQRAQRMEARAGTGAGGQTGQLAMALIQQQQREHHRSAAAQCDHRTGRMQHAARPTLAGAASPATRLIASDGGIDSAPRERPRAQTPQAGGAHPRMVQRQLMAAVATTPTPTADGGSRRTSLPAVRTASRGPRALSRQGRGNARVSGIDDSGGAVVAAASVAGSNLSLLQQPGVMGW